MQALAIGSSSPTDKTAAGVPLVEAFAVTLDSDDSIAKCSVDYTLGNIAMVSIKANLVQVNEDAKNQAWPSIQAEV